MREDFAVFILSNGRADNLHTLKMLKKVNYTGKYYIVCDDQDQTLSRYKELYGDKVVVFDKAEIAKRVDTGTNDPDLRAVVFARNACFDIAEKLGLGYFLQLDDDYRGINFRFMVKDGTLRAQPLKESFDKVCEAFVRFLETTEVSTIAMAQTGDLIGGKGSSVWKKVLPRKAMNSFFCKTDRRFWFIGKSNEDVSTYVTLGNKGIIFFTYARLFVDVVQTQSLSGGMSEFYESGGGYVKPFSSVVFSPQAIKVSTMGVTHRRFHHRINWNLCTPMILNQKWKKKRTEG
jgi:hypothetical protein